MSTTRDLSSVRLDNPHTRYLLGNELPELPRELLEADTYLLTIVAAALLDGDPEEPDGTDEAA